MSKEKRAASKQLSSEGTSTGTNTANLEQQRQQQHHHYHEQTTAATVQQSTTDECIATPEASAQSTDMGTGAEEADSPLITTIAARAERSSPPAETSEAPYSEDSPRQVIAVSASKSPAAFFNLARKFLVTNEMCDLSALEGAIVSAVDAAHLLERSQLASIVRIHTSYVSVEPKRKKQSSQQEEQEELLLQTSAPLPTELAVGGEIAAASAASGAQQLDTPRTSGEEAGVSSSSGPAANESTSVSPSSRKGSSGGRELRRARIVVTVRRTESYKRWLEENPLQAIIASEVDEDAVESMGSPPPT